MTNFSQRRASHKFDRDRYFTSEDVIERARKVMGSIDLDPASERLANETVKAKRYYTKIQNGLNRPWLGNVWLNPPYSKGKIDRFIGKSVIEYRSRRTVQMMTLVNVSGSSKWWHLLLRAATAWELQILFFKQRLKFYNPEVEELIRKGVIERSDSNNASQALFYFNGNDWIRKHNFKKHFKSLGTIVEIEGGNIKGKT